MSKIRKKIFQIDKLYKIPEFNRNYKLNVTICTQK